MSSTSLIQYFKHTIHDEDIVPRPPEWGKSAIYFETSEEGFVIRQIQLFESGIVLAYDDHHYHDAHGWRFPNPIYIEPPATVAISSKEFHRVWMRHHEAYNRTRKQNS